MNEKKKIKYIFKVSDSHSFEYEIDLNRNHNYINQDITNKDWVKLEFSKCSICTLSAADFKVCPVVYELYDISEFFNNLKSYELVETIVITDERIYSKKTDAQSAMNSLIGLVMATSECPILSRLKSMAYFHLPFASYEDTLIRTLSFYLIKQYFNYQNGGEADLNLIGLKELYKNLSIVNQCLNERLSKASKTDSNANAIFIFFSISNLVEFSINEKMKDIEKYFLTSE